MLCRARCVHKACTLIRTWQPSSLPEPRSPQLYEPQFCGSLRQRRWCYDDAAQNRHRDSTFRSQWLNDLSLSRFMVC